MSKQGRVYRHGDAWAFDIDVGPSTGQRNRKRGGGFSTKREATAASEAMRSRFVDVTDPTTVDLGTYLDEWLDQREASHAIAPTTVRGYRLHARKAHELLPGIPLDQLTAANLDHTYRRLLTGDTIDGRRLSNRSVRAFYTTIHKALKDGVRKGMVSRNVAALSNPPSTLASSPKVKHNHWSIEEVQAFLAAGRLPAYRRAASRRTMRAGMGRRRLRGADLDRRADQDPGRPRSHRRTTQDGTRLPHHEHQRRTGDGAPQVEGDAGPTPAGDWPSTVPGPNQ